MRPVDRRRSLEAQMQRKLFVPLTIIVALCVLLTVTPAIAQNNNEKEQAQGGKHGPPGTPGPQGATGPSGPPGTAGQNIARVQAASTVLYPGQTAMIATVNVAVTSASGGFLLISSYGSITSSQSPGGLGAVMDVGVLIN